MGCASSTPTKEGGSGSQAAKPRAKGTTRKPELTIGPNYKPVKHLGTGGTGDTWLFKNVQTGENVAVKFIKRPLPKVLLTNTYREFTIQAELGTGHANVIKAYDAVLTPDYLCLVMECAMGGSLTAYVADKWQEAQAKGTFLSEDEARYVFKQFLSAVSYCHAHNVAHRDLKLDNTLLDGTDPPVVKICDFGFAKSWSEEANMFTQIGTPVYMSPELIRNDASKTGYDGRSVDVWASGILLLVMLLGAFPYDHTDNPDPNTDAAHAEVWLKQMTERWNEVPHMREAIEKLSFDCKNLLNHIFSVKVNERITIEQIKQHPWYLKPLPEPYASKLESIEKSQEAIDARIRARNENAAAVKKRDDRILALITEATRVGNPSDPIKDISLRDEAVLDPVVAAREGNLAPADAQ